LRYFDIDSVSFTNRNGVTVPVKDKRPIENLPKSFKVAVNKGLLDEIASRQNVYGEGAEDQAYKIMDANIIKIVESGYDITKLREVDIPL